MIDSVALLCPQPLLVPGPCPSRAPSLPLLQVSKLAKNEVLMLNIGSMCTGARVLAVSAQSTAVMPCACLLWPRRLCLP
jgi:hypothetical protein